MSAKKHYEIKPDYAASPGELLLDVLEQRGISQAEFARSISVSQKALSLITKGISALSNDMANRFERALDIPVPFWLNAERNYRRRNTR